MIPIFLCFKNLLFIKLKRGFEVRFSSITVPKMTLLFILIHIFMVIEIDCLDGVHTLDLP